MQSPPRKITFKFRNGANNTTDSSEPVDLDRTPEKIIDNAASEEEEDASQDEDGEDDQSHEDVGNQLVVYDPEANGGGEIVPVPDPISSKPPYPSFSPQNYSSRVLPSVGAFTVQCANCFKWRLIPTKEKYEEIREHILEHPFICESAREWRPDVSCDDPPDISQDGSRLWAIDKPNIAQPPPGWQRLLRIRGEGSTRFADVYYASPSGKRLRSMVEIHKYLLKHPEYIEQGVNLSQFSFQIPKPLQENYVRKRPARLTASYESSNVEFSQPLDPSEVNPLAVAGPDDCTTLQLGGPGLSTPPEEESAVQPAKKQARRASPKPIQISSPASELLEVKIEEPRRSFTGECDP